MTSHSDDFDEMGEPHGDETPLRLRPMPTDTVKGLVDRAEALLACGKAMVYTASIGLLGAMVVLRREVDAFSEPGESNPWSARRRFLPAVRAVAKSARDAAEMQLAGVAGGLALDIEAAIAGKSGHE